MRLNAYLARAGIASRRKADELIKAGRVLVNGEPASSTPFVERRQGRGRRPPVAPQRLAVHPPEQARRPSRPRATRTAARTVVDLVPHEPRVVPVGRLDVDTTGALLLTNDGALAHRLAHPRYEVEKVYVAEVER